MPELPEVEVMAQKLHTWSLARSIEKATVLRQNGKYNVEGIVGRRIFDVQRRGKRIFIVFIGDLCLSVHNAMSGYWDASDDTWTFDYVEGKRESTMKDVRVELQLDNGRILRFHDQRLFGSMKPMTWDEAKEEILKMGPEAIGTKRMYSDYIIADEYMIKSFKDDKRPVKEILLDQSVLAGVGNIYAAEALWMSRIHPGTLGHELTHYQVVALTEAIKRALSDALERNLEYDGLLIYRRKECPEKHPVEKIEIAKRQTYFCPKCQERK